MLNRYDRLMQLVKEGKEYCLADDAAEYLNADPATIRRKARDCPEKLGFAVIVFGKRVCIPIVPFIMSMTGASYADVIGYIENMKES